MKGLEAWSRWFALQQLAIMKDIDSLWDSYNLYRFIPSPWQYTAVGLAIAIPFMLVCTLLCCLLDEDDAKPQYTDKSAAPKAASSKKGGSRAEKLD